MTYDTSDVTRLTGMRDRVQMRIDACLERHGGDIKAAATGDGFGVGYLMAIDLAYALDEAATEITRLRAALAALVAAVRAAGGATDAG